MLKIIHRAISTFLIKQAGLKVSGGHTGAVTLIQRFGSATNFNIHLHCLFLDGIYRQVDGKKVFESVTPSNETQLQQLLHQLIQRLMMRCLVRQGALTEDEGQLNLNALDDDMNPSLAPLQAAACTYSIMP